VGFLFSYAALVSRQSDFIIAHEKHLLPQEVDWSAWKKSVKELLDNESIYRDVDPRFHYGERTPLRAYRSYWNQYGSFFEATLHGWPARLFT
ncbi:UDP-N-acetylglucosamine transferase subunit ALG13, partial [Colletotrichum asianum]